MYENSEYHYRIYVCMIHAQRHALEEEEKEYTTWCREMRYRGMNGHATSYTLNVPNWGESFVWHPAAATTHDSSFSLSLFLSPSLTLLIPFFSSTLVIAPRTIGARRSQWLAGINDGRSPPSVTASLCLSSERWSVVQWCYETCELTGIRTHHSYIASV